MDLPKIKTAEPQTIKEARKNKRKMSAKIITILVLTVFITSAVTYGYFAANKSQTGNNTLLTECFNIDMTNESASINLSNAYPISNKKGQETTPYSFTLTNTCATTAKYYIIVDTKTNSFDDTYLNVSVNKENPKNLSHIENTSYPADSGYQSSHIIKTGTLIQNASKDFDVRIWIDEATTYEQLASHSWEGQVRIVSVVADVDKYSTPSGQTLAKLGIEVNENEPDFTKPAPTVLTYKDGEFKKNVIIDNYSHPTSKYYTYSDRYNFNPETREYSLINPQVCKYSECYETLKGKYITDKYGTITQSIDKYENLEEIFKVDESSTESILYCIESSYTVGTFKAEESGVFAMEDDYGESYYYRGNIENNYIKFGKWNDNLPTVYKGYYHDTYNYSDGQNYNTLEECQNKIEEYGYIRCEEVSMAGQDMYWRILRINGDGSLRIIYDGTQAYINSNTIADKTIGISEWNPMGDAKYSGYMYGDTGEQLSTSKEQAQKNDISSTIKTFLDNWYAENLLNTPYEQYISDTLFCNDRSTTSNPTDFALDYVPNDTGLGYGINDTSFGYINRLHGNERGLTSANISFKCPQKNDAFTVRDTQKGNGALTYSIGLVTADELNSAGASATDNNLYYYLSAPLGFWTMTPDSIEKNSNYIFTETTFIGGLASQAGDSVKPVINISKEYIENLTGSGTITDPYTFS